ncbi:MAG: ABC transporter ATP-binding protein [Bacillota bacterium]|nr:ABC transporter ATP-binding protein [Bacillota bacterium]
MLEIKNLRVAYGAIRAVRDVNLVVPKGQTVVLLGANGAGKTSTLRAVTGSVRAEGSILFEGREIIGKRVYQIARMGINMSPEGRLIFPDLTVEENLRAGGFALGKAELHAQTERAFAQFPILSDRRKQAAGTLSGGEQQMLAISRAMMAKPKLLILDEPSLGLAPMIIKEIFASLRHICKQGTTILMVEQNARAALEIADYAYVMELGVTTMKGTAEEMLSDRKLAEAYLGSRK